MRSVAVAGTSLTGLVAVLLQQLSEECGCLLFVQLADSDPELSLSQFIDGFRFQVVLIDKAQDQVFLPIRAAPGVIVVTTIAVGVVTMDWSRRRIDSVDIIRDESGVLHFSIHCIL